jgi:hypothetical protein
VVATRLVRMWLGVPVPKHGIRKARTPVHASYCESALRLRPFKHIRKIRDAPPEEQSMLITWLDRFFKKFSRRLLPGQVFI